MEWQAIVFALQILLLATSWVLFQKARAELSAQAVETPVLNEVRALQKNVKQLLAEIESASDRSAAQLEARCEKAQELLAALEQKTEAAPAPRRTLPALPARPKRTPRVGPTARANWKPTTDLEPEAQALVAQSPLSAAAARRQEVYALTDAGESVAAIARHTGISEGEIETWIGLRKNRY